MTTAAWVIKARAKVHHAKRKAVAMFAKEARRDLQRAKRAASDSGWWSDLQDHWAEEAFRNGERWFEQERW
jgi:hypothetical protein